MHPREGVVKPPDGLPVKLFATFAGPRMRLLRDRRVIRLALTAFLLVLTAFFCRPLLLLLFPGTFAVFLQRQKPYYLSDLLPFAVGTSMAFWVVSFWFLGHGKIPLSCWAWGMIFLAMLLSGVVLWRRDRSVWIPVDREEPIALFLLLAAAILRFSLFWRWPLAPAGADMSMHSYMAALIVATDGVPLSHRPLLPIEGFGAYPAGFQILTALMSILGDMPIYRAAMLMEATALMFLTLAFYSFLRVFWGRPTSAMVALLVTFLPRNPQYFIQWGGDPTLLALAMLVLGLGFLPMLKEQMAWDTWSLGGLLMAASVLTHLIPVVGLLYASIPVAMYVGIHDLARQQGEISRVLRNVLGIGVISSVFVAVCLPHWWSTEVSAAEVEWVKRFQQEWSGGAWGGTLGNAVLTIPQYLTEKLFGGPFLVFSSLGLLTLALRRPALAVACAIWGLTVVGLVINSMYWVLPLSYALYPERVAVLLLLPCALGIAALLDGARELVAKRAFMVWVMAVLVLFVTVRPNEKLFYKGVIPHTLVTPTDLQAMQWIHAHTDPRAVFRNQYGDAGLWIPAIAFRAITDPHLNPFYFDEFRAASRELEARYVYIGKKKALGEPISIQEFESRPDRYRKVYDHDGVMIYESITPPTQAGAE
jgi:hypothetical protein